MNLIGLWYNKNNQPLIPATHRRAPILRTAPETDSNLIRQIAAGDADALQQLFQRYERLVFSLALRIVDETTVAEEVTLDVFLRVWQKADHYRAEKAQVKTWLMRITRNIAIDHLRRNSRRGLHTQVDWADSAHRELLPVAPSSEETASANIRQESVVRAVSSLPDNQQTALSMAYFKGYSHREIAQILNEPVGTVKTRIRLAMKKLRHLLHDET